MIFSTRSTYGLRAMINLAKHQKQGSLPLAAIAKAENISLKYLEKLFAGLKKSGLVRAEIGAGGGYKLAKAAKYINVYDIIKALEGEFNSFHCTGDKEKIYCNSGCDCEVTYVLGKVERAINSSLNSIKLSKLI